MTEELISVIVPVYNVEDYLQKCISSIVSQTYSNLEIILVDDGSSDNCPKICDEWASKDERIIVIHKPNGGLSDARNAGMDIMNGVYVSFVDGDDYIDEKYIEILYNNLVKYNADVSQVSLCINNKKTNDSAEIYVLDSKTACKNFFISKFPSMTISSCAKLCKTESIGKQRFPNGRNYEDLYLTPRIVYFTGKTVISSEPLYCYVYRQDSITRIPFTSEKMINILWVVKDNFLYFKEKKEYLMAIRLWLHRKKLIYKLNLEAFKENLHNEVPVEFRKSYLTSRINYFIFSPYREKKSIIYDVLINRRENGKRNNG